MMMGPTGRELFEAFKQKMLGECGTCHQLGGAADAPFLAMPDPYVSITSWPGIVVANPSQSTLLTHPADPSHGAGQAPDLSPDLRVKAKAWLEKEAIDLPMPDAGNTHFIAPFKPFLAGAFNNIYLDPLGPGLQSSSISFNAEELGDPPSMLHLWNLQVHPVADVFIHVAHPLFTVYPAGKTPSPDPVDSFSTLETTFSLATPLDLGTGELFLTNWVKDARMDLAFETIKATNAQGGIPGKCKDVASFTQHVVPSMQLCAMMCHAGTKPEAQAAMDLAELNTMPPTRACDQVHARIVPGDPASSPLLIVTDPAQPAVHLFKFTGSTTKYNAFKTAVTPWIDAEK